MPNEPKIKQCRHGNLSLDPISSLCSLYKSHHEPPLLRSRSLKTWQDLPWRVCFSAMSTQTTTLYRPVGQAELDLIAATSMRRFPRRLPDQPIFYPVCNEEYGAQIASRWNTANGAVGYVTRFEVQTEFLAKYEIHVVGSKIHAEYWIPAEELEAFNDAICGTIEVISEHRA